MGHGMKSRGFLESASENFWYYLEDYFTMTGKLQPLKPSRTDMPGDILVGIN
jgi:hypothetical protein